MYRQNLNFIYIDMQDYTLAMNSPLLGFRRKVKRGSLFSVNTISVCDINFEKSRIIFWVEKKCILYHGLWDIFVKESSIIT